MLEPLEAAERVLFRLSRGITTWIEGLVDGQVDWNRYQDGKDKTMEETVQSDGLC